MSWQVKVRPSFWDQSVVLSQAVVPGFLDACFEFSWWHCPYCALCWSLKHSNHDDDAGCKCLRWHCCCITCTLFTWTHDYCWPCRQCLYCNPSWETIQAHYTTCLPCYQLCQHLLHAERPTKETSIWMEVGNQNSIEQHSHGPVRCFDPHLLWENLKVTKLCRLMEAVNVKRARCLVLRVNHRRKVLRLLSSNGRELKIWESNIWKTYLWNFKDWWSKYIKVMEIQSDDWNRNDCPCLRIHEAAATLAAHCFWMSCIRKSFEALLCQSTNGMDITWMVTSSTVIMAERDWPVCQRFRSPMPTPCILLKLLARWEPWIATVTLLWQIWQTLTHYTSGGAQIHPKLSSWHGKALSPTNGLDFGRVWQLFAAITLCIADLGGQNWTH